MPLSVSY